MLFRSLSDKVTVRSMLKPFSDYLVPCYFQISRRDGEPFVIPMADLEGEYSKDLKGVRTFLEEKKVLEICRSKGKRSLLLSYKEGAYFVNGKEISAEKLELLMAKFSGISVIRAHDGGGKRIPPFFYIVDERREFDNDGLRIRFVGVFHAQSGKRCAYSAYRRFVAFLFIGDGAVG